MTTLELAHKLQTELEYAANVALYLAIRPQLVKDLKKLVQECRDARSEPLLPGMEE